MYMNMYNIYDDYDASKRPYDLKSIDVQLYMYNVHKSAILLLLLMQFLFNHQVKVYIVHLKRTFIISLLHNFPAFDLWSFVLHCINYMHMYTWCDVISFLLLFTFIRDKISSSHRTIIFCVRRTYLILLTSEMT